MSAELTRWDPSTAHSQMQAIAQMARAVAQAGIFGTRDESQVIALMLVSAADGLHPIQAMRRYHVIQGRAALKADAVLADYQGAGGKVRWTEYTDTRVTGVFSSPAGGELTVGWTIEQARAAGLAGKDVWKSYPRAMLRSRVIAEGVRATMPGVLVGLLTVEEAQDLPPAAREMLAEIVTPAVAAVAPVATTAPAVPPLATTADLEAQLGASASMATPEQIRKLQTLLSKLGVGGAVPKGEGREEAVRAARLGWIAQVVERHVSSSKDLLGVEATACIQRAEADLAEAAAQGEVRS